jgi:hypothetical protein
MKTADEIRKHRDALKFLCGVPCGCDGTLHALECFIGGKMMQASVEELSWVLGENGDMDRRVEEVAASAARRKGGS